MFLDFHVSGYWIRCFLTFLKLSTEVQKCSLLQVSHLLSDLQGQNPGEVGLFCCRLCFEERCTLTHFSFFKRIPHSGHWFVLGCDCLSFLLLSSREHLFLLLVSFCCAIFLTPPHTHTHFEDNLIFLTFHKFLIYRTWIRKIFSDNKKWPKIQPFCKNCP